MKSKVLLMCMVLCAMATGFVSCESVGIGKRTALINLAELGKQIDYQTKDEAEKIISRKGFVKFYEERIEGSKYSDGIICYSNGMQLDSTMTEDEIITKIRLQKENATILIMDYKLKDEKMLVELYATYILPSNPMKDYKKLSKDLYTHHVVTFPFQSNEPNQELSQFYKWSGAVLGEDEEWYDYSNNDELYAFAVQTGKISQEDYDELMSAPHEDGFRDEFEQKLMEPYGLVWEEIWGENSNGDISYASLEIENDYPEIGNMTIAVCGWCGQELSHPQPLDLVKWMRNNVCRKKN